MISCGYKMAGYRLPQSHPHSAASPYCLFFHLFHRSIMDDQEEDVVLEEARPTKRGRKESIPFQLNRVLRARGFNPAHF